jgi:hypothetical protein
MFVLVNAGIADHGPTTAPKLFDADFAKLTNVDATLRYVGARGLVTR